MQGVQFMYDNLVVNTEQLREGGEGAKGNGCILAHCMGLGKTLQVGGTLLSEATFVYVKATMIGYTLEGML